MLRPTARLHSCGPVHGGDVYSPAMTDFIFMVRDTSYMFVTGPDVVKTVTNEIVTAEELAAPRARDEISIADGAYDNDLECLLQMRRPSTFCRQVFPRRARMAVARQGRARGGLARHAGARQSQQALPHQGADPQSRRRGRFLRAVRNLRPQHRHRPRPHRRPQRRLRRQSADGPGRRARLRRQPQGRAFRALLRRLQHSDRHFRRHAPASCPAPRRNMAA